MPTKKIIVFFMIALTIGFFVSEALAEDLEAQAQLNQVNVDLIRIGAMLDANLQVRNDFAQRYVELLKKQQELSAMRSALVKKIEADKKEVLPPVENLK